MTKDPFDSRFGRQFGQVVARVEPVILELVGYARRRAGNRLVAGHSRQGGVHHKMTMAGSTTAAPPALPPR